MTRMILIGVKFEGGDVHIPGLGGVDQLPDKQSGWTGKLEGYSMRVVGERLEVWCPAGIKQTEVAQAELTANGIEHDEALAMRSIPLSKCILSFVATSSDMTMAGDAAELTAPSKAYRKPKPPEPKPVNENAPSLPENVIGQRAAAALASKAASVAAAKAPQPTPRGPVAPTPRKPPNARGPSKETGIVRDLSAQEAEARDVEVKQRSVGLAVDHVAGAAELEE